MDDEKYKPCARLAKYASVKRALSESSDFDYESDLTERTLAIIKPEAYCDAEAIEKHITDYGFQILAKRIVLLTPELVAELYKTKYGGTDFPHLVAHMSSGPIVAMVLSSRNAIQRFRKLMGPAKVAEAQAYWPDSLRASYGRRSSKQGDFFNAIHGSENLTEAQREIHFFFPNMIVGPLLRNNHVKDYIQKKILGLLTPGLSALAHERPAEPILWLAEYLRKHNPNAPKFASSTEGECGEECCPSACSSCHGINVNDKY